MIRAASEVTAEYIQQMGEGLGRLYAALMRETCWVEWKWSEYIELFGTKPSRIDLLNRAAPRFSKLMQDIFWEDILLHRQAYG